MKRENKKSLAAVVSTFAAATLLGIVARMECGSGKCNAAYVDPVGIVTACFGDTNNVELGKTYSDAECKERLEQQLVAHGEPVLRCTPQIKGNDYFTIAAISFAYNIGTGAYCNSDAAKYFREGEFAKACRSINESDAGKPQWVSVKDKKVKDPETGQMKQTYKILPGLVKRRAEERAICERGL